MKIETKSGIFFFELKLWSGVVVIFLVSPLRAYKFYANVADV